MGNPILLQACLRLDKNEIPNKLELGKKYNFSKDGHRLYQIKVPMDLRSSNWDFYCRIIIVSYTLGENKTEGIFIPVKIFSEEERKIITKTYVSDQEVEILLKKF